VFRREVWFMMRVRSWMGAVLVALTVTPIAQAATIVSVDPFLGAAHGGLGVGAANQFPAVSWTQTSTYTDVVIKAWVGHNDLEQAPVTAWLTQSIGPGAAPGSELAQTAVVFPDFSVPYATTVFSGQTLGPGTWYLLMSAAPNFSNGWGQGSPGSAVTGTGVTLNEAIFTYGALANFAYPPASDFVFINQGGSGLAFSVEGTEVIGTIPEPASLVLTGTGLLALIRIGHRRAIRVRRACDRLC
jgi:hypothetical protein